MIGSMRRKVVRNVRRLALVGMAGILAASCLSEVSPEVPDKAPVGDPSVLMSVNEGREDSFRNPTPMGSVPIPGRSRGNLTRRQQVHRWLATPGREMTVTLTAAAADGDMYLFVYERAGRRWSYIASNDDCGDGSTNACLQNLHLANLEYLIVVSTYSYVTQGRADSAAYTLTVDLVSGEGQTCGTRGSAPCPDGTYCDYAEGSMCGAADQGGVCRVRPQMCTLQYDPQCGCDGHTYSNSCSAASAGVDVSYSGVCRGDAGSTCGGIATLDCNEGLFCNYTETACDISDPAGYCDYPVERMCTRDYRPQCGCDDVT